MIVNFLPYKRPFGNGRYLRCVSRRLSPPGVDEGGVQEPVAKQQEDRSELGERLDFFHLPPPDNKNNSKKKKRMETTRFTINQTQDEIHNHIGRKCNDRRTG